MEKSQHLSLTAGGMNLVCVMSLFSGIALTGVFFVIERADVPFARAMGLFVSLESEAR